MTPPMIRDAMFDVTRVGYDPLAVDPLLNDIASRLEHDQDIDAERLRGIRLPMTRDGYDPGQVDDLLDRIRMECETV
ncbi:DivIVA domain-containing protein [Bifidobacterium sp. SO1]|uniref:DivIVA domain-containing protein n=1 Tax=Bifidobacterium sp. SO1 TaxID=2809029 RepID=UPI001BDC9765|nr:DivIVA domain-containing protein [Bifidobacterium sp. SO1]MBT1161705.1 DivIVA domain-containing protein [Bifidobacterium sp. SO1]